jgi:hypothetical protein
MAGMQGLDLDGSTHSATTPMHHHSTSYGSPALSAMACASSSCQSSPLDRSFNDNESFVSDIAPVVLYGGGTGTASTHSSCLWTCAAQR